MSTAAAGGRPHGALTRGLAWLTHFEPYLMIAMAPLFIAGQLWEPLSWASMPVLWAAVASQFGEFAHERVYPCDRCVERFPVNAPAEAARKAWALRLHHCKKLLIATLGTLLVVLIAMLALDATTDWADPMIDIAFPIVGAALYLSSGGSAYLRHTHRKLQLWCPICRRRDEDDDPIVIPEPTPPSARVDA